VVRSETVWVCGVVAEPVSGAGCSRSRPEGGRGELGVASGGAAGVAGEGRKSILPLDGRVDPAAGAACTAAGGSGTVAGFCAGAGETAGSRSGAGRRFNRPVGGRDESAGATIARGLGLAEGPSVTRNWVGVALGRDAGFPGGSSLGMIVAILAGKPSDGD
jgi:hypothetical protein